MKQSPVAAEPPDVRDLNGVHAAAWNRDAWGSRSVDEGYEKIEQIGEGTYGYVACASRAVACSWRGSVRNSRLCVAKCTWLATSTRASWWR